MGQQTSTTTRASDFDPTQARLTGADGGTPITTEIIYGQDDEGTDYKVFGDTSGTYMLWDESADSLLLVGTAARFSLGSFTGAAIGTGSIVSSSVTAPFKVFADDGGAAIGSGSLVRAGWFRNLQTYTTGNREQESTGVQGSIVSVAGTNRHNMSGVLGSYEARTSLTVGGQVATTDTWCQAAVIGRVGAANNILTIGANGVLAGVAAMSNVTTALAANSGIFAGFYVGKWGGASGTDSWSHGLYIQALAVDKAIQVGELSSTAQTGFHLTAANNEAVDILADDNNTTLTNAVYSNIRARTMLFKTATGISLFGVKGQIKVADEVDFGPGVFAPVQGYLETMDDTDILSGAKVWGVDSSIESPSGGTVTVKSGGILGGLHAELTGAGEFVQDSTGILAGLYIDEQVATGKWGYGIYATGVQKAGYFSTAFSGSGYALELVLTGTHTSATSIGTLRIDHTTAGTGGTWAGGLYVTLTQGATKNVNGYFCAAELEMVTSATPVCHGSVLVLDAINNGAPIEFGAFIDLRDYGSIETPLFIWAPDTAISTHGAGGDERMFSTVNSESPCTHKLAIRVASTDYWIMCTDEAPSQA